MAVTLLVTKSVVKPAHRRKSYYEECKKTMDKVGIKGKSCTEAMLSDTQGICGFHLCGFLLDIAKSYQLVPINSCNDDKYSVWFSIPQVNC